MEDWVTESAERPSQVGLRLGPEVIEYSLSPAVGFRARWDQIFGIALLPPDAPETLFILVPRKPPAPPWFEVTESMLSPEDQQVGLVGLAARVQERAAQGSYRHRGPRRPAMAPAQLMERILARQEVPGALEIPVAAGPGGWWRRSLDLFAAGSAGGLVGLYGGALTGSAALALAVAAAGAVAGAAVPVFVAANWRSVRRIRKPRVLVLAPDGCVVGLPSGPRALAWKEIGAFSENADVATGRAQLQVTLANGAIAGALDAAWFGAPLPLIVAVAEAYRQRQTR